MPPIVSAIGAVLGGMGLLGVAYAVFTSAKVQKTVELYKLENEAQGKRIGTLEGDKTTLGERVAALERENLTLKDLATGKTFMEVLSKEITEAEAQRLLEHRAMLEALHELKETLAEMWQGMIRFFGGRGD
jgi:hypothetical protein